MLIALILCNTPVYADGKVGTQKVLCLMVESESQPFKVGHDERYYSNMFFGKSKNSLAEYVKEQSNGKFKIKPADTKKTKYPGVIKVGMKSKTVAADDYNFQSKIVVSSLNHISDRLNLKAIDVDGNKQFKESFLVDKEDSKEEFLIITIISGSTNSEDDVEENQAKAWPHLEQIHTDVNGYKFRNTSIISSEKVEGKTADVSVFSHEFMHNLNARDMYLDNSSIGKWSAMSKPGEAIDPIHKLYLGWATPKPVKRNIPFRHNKREVPYIKQGNDVYLFDYRDGGAIVWKINKKELERDWKFDDNCESYDWYINSSGVGSSVQVYPKPDAPYIKDGSSMKIPGTDMKVFVTKKQMRVN